MTIIAVTPGEMAADSWAFTSYVGYPKVEGHPKIFRYDGGLIGAAGNSPQLYALRQWIAAGMNFDKHPDFGDKEDDGVSVLWLRRDGSLWHFTQKFMIYPISIPYCVGQEHACHMAEGAILAGKTAGEALSLVVPRCQYTGGEIQVERLW